MAKKAKVGIIGAGFGGLASAYRLSKAGFETTVFESEDKPGGLAIGFEKKNWDWSLEKHYHHWFTNDFSILNLAKEIGHNVEVVRPTTSTYINENIYQFDSPTSLLKFTEIPLIDRLRTGAVMTYLKLTPFWKPLEKLTAKEFLIKYGGKKSWKVLWEPLFIGKFQKFADKVPASWFWARIKKRTASLAYPKGGFLEFAKSLEEKIRKNGGVFYYGKSVNEILSKKERNVLKAGGKTYEFDYIICTLPSHLFLKIAKGLPLAYRKKFVKLEGLGAVNLVLSLNEPLLKDGTYWLNVNEVDYPFLAVVEHTNFMDKKHYYGEHLVYVGNYLSQEHEYFKKSSKELVEEFLPYLKKINPSLKKSQIRKSYVFKAPFAQPIIPLNFSSNVPDFKTPVNGLYLCNIQQVYPWDRGTNYAVENGEKVADMIINNNLP